MSVSPAESQHGMALSATLCSLGPVGAWALLSGTLTEGTLGMLIAAIGIGLVIGYAAFSPIGQAPTSTI